MHNRVSWDRGTRPLPTLFENCVEIWVIYNGWAGVRVKSHLNIRRNKSMTFHWNLSDWAELSMINHWNFSLECSFFKKTFNWHILNDKHRFHYLSFHESTQPRFDPESRHPFPLLWPLEHSGVIFNLENQWISNKCMSLLCRACLRSSL